VLGRLCQETDIVCVLARLLNNCHATAGGRQSAFIGRHGRIQGESLQQYPQVGSASQACFLILGLTWDRVHLYRQCVDAWHRAIFRKRELKTILEQLRPTSGRHASSSQVAQATRRLTRLSLMPDHHLDTEQVTT
jgi:hypothetical protein